jgi:hypothetical protein
MAIKFLAFDDQFVADFSSHDQQDDLVPFNIIQYSQVAGAQLKLSQRIWS